jgi:DNA-directed RNA polymerase specialized sigma24 family protein
MATLFGSNFMALSHTKGCWHSLGEPLNSVEYMRNILVAAVLRDFQSEDVRSVMADIELTPYVRKVLALRYHNGMDYEQIQKVTGIPCGTARRMVTDGLADILSQYRYVKEELSK